MQPKNTIIKPEPITTPKRAFKKSNSIRFKTEKSIKNKTSSKHNNIYHYHQKKSNKNIKKKLFQNNEDSEAHENNKYNLNREEYHSRNLTKNKKNKKFGDGWGGMMNMGVGGRSTEKFIKNKNNEHFLPLEEENIKEINETNTKKGAKRKRNVEREEEIQILNEVEEMDEALSLDEKKFVSSQLMELRNLIVNNTNKDKTTKDKIESIRLALYKIVNKFFINWIRKDLTLKIIEPEKYQNKLKKLIKIQNYRIFSEKNLKILENKYIIPYIEKENQRKKEEEEKKQKLKKKKIALEEFERYKKLIEEKKRTGLIYDNSYLFKKGKQKMFKLRKEVEEILNTDYGKYYVKKKKIKSEEKRPKNPKKNKGKKITPLKKSILVKKELTKEEKDEEAERIRLFKEMEERERREELLDKRLQDFFERIQKLKNGKFKNFEEELNYLIDEQIDKAERAKENKEMRMNSFMKDLQFNMVKERYTRNFKNKQIAYISPIKFTSDNL